MLDFIVMQMRKANGEKGLLAYRRGRLMESLKFAHCSKILSHCKVNSEQLQNTAPLTPSLNLLLLWSAVHSRLAQLYVYISVELKCYHSPQSHSQ